MEHQLSPLPGRGNVRWRIAIPMVLALIGTLLLVGCIYLPIPEHSANWSLKDFRPVLDSPASPIRPGQVTRDRIIQLLGRPYSEDAVRRQIVYRYDTEAGLQVWPTCFIIAPTSRDSFAVRFSFDANDILQGCERAHQRGGYGGGAIQSPIPAHPDATRDFESDRPSSVPSSQPAAQP